MWMAEQIRVIREWGAMWENDPRVRYNVWKAEVDWQAAQAELRARAAWDGA